MANAIKTAGSIASILKYIQDGKTLFSGSEPIPFVSNTKGDITFVDPGKITAIITITKDAKTKKDVISKYTTITVPLDSFITKMKSIKDIKEARALLNSLTFKEGNVTYHFGDMAKPTDKIPLGYIAETILQAAIIARFVMRDKNNSDISVKDIEKYIGYYIKSEEKWNAGSSSKQVNRIVRFKAPNLVPDLVDDSIIGYMSLNTGAYAYLEKSYSKGSMSKDAMIGPFFRDSLTYVNKSEPKTHAWYFYTNGKTDLIEILSTSIIGQQEGRKADVITKYREGYTGTPSSGKPVKFDLELSIKIKGTTQFGQSTNIHLDSISKFMGYLGVKLDSKTKNDIETIFAKSGVTFKDDGKTTKLLLHDKPVTAPTLQNMGVYESVMNIMYDKLKSVKNLNQVLPGIIDAMASKEEQERLPSVSGENSKDKLPARPGLSIIDIGEGVSIYDINKVLPYLQSKGGVTTELKTSDVGNYSLTVYYKGEVFVTLASRRIQNNFRNYIQSGIVLRKWMSRPSN